MIPSMELDSISILSEAYVVPHSLVLLEHLDLRFAFALHQEEEAKSSQN